MPHLLHPMYQMWKTGLTSHSLKVRFHVYGRNKEAGALCTITLLGNCKTFIETIGSFLYSTVTQMLYRNEKPTGVEHYTHSSQMASTRLMETPITLMTALSLSVSAVQMLFLPPHNHSETAQNWRHYTTHTSLTFVKAGF